MMLAGLITPAFFKPKRRAEGELYLLGTVGAGIRRQGMKWITPHSRVLWNVKTGESSLSRCDTVRLHAGGIYLDTILKSGSA